MKSLLVHIIFWVAFIISLFFLINVIRYSYNNFDLVTNFFVDFTSILCVGILVDKIVNKLDKL